jgi:hypothetical protein
MSSSSLASRLVRPKHRVLVVAPRRSGQHLVIDYLARGLGETRHINNVSLGSPGLLPRLALQRLKVTPYSEGEAAGSAKLRGPILRPERLVTHTVANVELARAPYPFRRFYRGRTWTMVPLVRDPYNWLASLVKVLHRESYIKEADVPSYIGMYKALLALHDERGPGVWSYNSFVADPAYRAERARLFDGFKLEWAERALGETPRFGGGSSFGGQKADAESLRQAVFERWKSVTDDPVYRRLIRDAEMLDAYARVFGDLPEAREWADSL